MNDITPADRKVVNIQDARILIFEGELHESDGRILKAGDLVFYCGGS